MSYSGEHLLERHPEIQESYFWDNEFWKVGCYGGTPDTVLEEVAERYSQENRH